MLELYLSHLALRSFRPSTIALRERVLHNLARTLEPRTLADADRHDLELFIGRPSLSPGTRRVYRSCVRGFYGWAVAEDLLPVDPSARIPSIRVRKGTPRPLDDASLRFALAAADQRTYCWILLMALGGLRCCEVARLRPVDILRNETGPVLYIREAKGGASAAVPAHPLIMESLTAMPVVGGLWWDVSPKWVSESMSRYLHGLGIDASGHALRHTAATWWLHESDILTTSVLMRHRSLDTTSVYAQLEAGKPARVVDAVRLPS